MQITDSVQLCLSILASNASINLPPEHPIMSFETIEIKIAAVSGKSYFIYRMIRALVFSHLAILRTLNDVPELVRYDES